MSLSRLLFESLFGPEIQVHDPSFLRDVLLRGSLGLGDSYIEGKWDHLRIDELVCDILSKGIYQKIAPAYNSLRIVRGQFANFQDRTGSRKVIEEHYDLPVEMYAAFLDPFFQYTCALFDDTADLNQAQEQKMDLICQKLKLQEGQRVLDIGGGWGGLARFMSERYGVKPTVVTLSKEQAEHIQRTVKNVEVWCRDYRDIPKLLDEPFDAVSAVGIFEHIGHKNYSTFFRIVDQSLKRGGTFLLHTLYTPYSTPASNPWLHKHIFPNGELPPRKHIARAAQGTLMPYSNEHPHFQELTPHYHPTLVAWDKNLQDSLQQGVISMSQQERRKWHFYFMSCAGAIQAQHMRVGQFLYITV
ncbi:class I SAM-dependent methyltransferase [Candidatus Woesearchaeota archaeon]|nr:class I SAM-dependent methyltransferase [Candidatus Woesearchaeota archaeon]